ncbi:MAG: hypothetical protein H0T17_08940 [Propionibacteriales bacterium]|nr:hypothetical protein [Propionibacteriales bacterium]
MSVATGVLASSSLSIYLTHWQVYPHLEVEHPALAVVCSVAVGVAYWRLTQPFSRAVSRLLVRTDDPASSWRSQDGRW